MSNLAPIYTAFGFDISRAIASVIQGGLGFVLTIDYANLQPMTMLWSGARVLAARLIVDFYKISRSLSPNQSVLAVIALWSAMTYFHSGLEETKQHLLPTFAVIFALESAIERGLIPLPRM